jgi:branched-chain amino acid transport system substrate-binding protein
LPPKNSRRVTSRAVTGALTVVALTAVAACSSSGAGSNGTTAAASAASGGSLPASIPVTATLDLTGPLAYYGTQAQAGIKAGVAEVQKEGLLGNSKLVISVEDTGGSAATATSLAESAVKSGAVAVVGANISNEALAAAPVVSAASIPFLAPTAPDGLTSISKYVYSTSTSELVQLQNYTTTLVKAHPKVTVIYANDNDTTTELAGTLKNTMSQNGGTLVNSIPTPIAATDYSVLATKALDGSPDAIGIMSGGPQQAGLITTLRSLGYKGILFANMGADGTANAAGTAANGLEFQGEWASNVDSSASKTFATVFAAANPSMTPHYPAVDGYDTVMFLALALQKAHSVKGPELLAGLQQIASAGFGVPGGEGTFTGTTQQQFESPTLDLTYQDDKVLQVSSS